MVYIWADPRAPQGQGMWVPAAPGRAGPVVPCRSQVRQAAPPQWVDGVQPCCAGAQALMGQRVHVAEGQGWILAREELMVAGRA